MLSSGLSKNAAIWPGLARAYAWVQRAVRVLNNAAGADRWEVRRQYRHLLAAMAGARPEGGSLAGALEHFRQVTKSYWPGLFWCYEREEIPRTDNALEQCFGSVRYHERRASGRKSAAPGLVVRGQVRAVAVVLTRTQVLGPLELQVRDRVAWRKLRATLEYRHEARRRQYRFRHDPDAYLQQLEETLLKSSLPS